MLKDVTGGSEGCKLECSHGRFLKEAKYESGLEVRMDKKRRKTTYMIIVI